MQTFDKQANLKVPVANFHPASNHVTQLSSFGRKITDRLSRLGGENDFKALCKQQSS